jgi:hypothetical protein
VRFFGSDCGGGAINRIYSTVDDAEFDTQFLLTGDSDAYVWDMAQNDEGCTYAGTLAKLPEGSQVALYATYGDGPTWCTVKELGILPEWCGVNDISRFDSEGWAYCSYSTSRGSFSAFRFRRQPSAGVDDEPPGSAQTDVALEVVPNPTAGQTSFRITTRASGDPLRVRILSASGACVRTLQSAQHSGTQHTLDWDGRSQSGDPVGSGVYFVEVAADGRRAAGKLLVIK